MLLQVKTEVTQVGQSVGCIWNVTCNITLKLTGGNFLFAVNYVGGNYLIGRVRYPPLNFNEKTHLTPSSSSSSSSIHLQSITRFITQLVDALNFLRQSRKCLSFQKQFSIALNKEMHCYKMSIFT